MSLDELAMRHGTDKSSASHNYTPLYESYFGQLAPSGSLLELGWGGHEDPDAGGASARMWRDWLPRKWGVTVVDNERKNLTRADRGIALLHGDQTDKALVAPFGPFDIIIDDASHVSSLTVASFTNLWPLLKPGGWYVVEDTHSSYHDWYYGASEADADPDTMIPTAMQFLKRLADEVNFHGDHPEDNWDLYPREYWLGYEVEAVHFHFNICFVQKRA